jgi:hypothetical protein
MAKVMVRAVEHLHKVVDQAVNSFSEGKMDGVQAKRNMMKEIEAVFVDLKPAAFRDVAFLRISIELVKESGEDLMTILSNAGIVESIRALPPDPVAPNPNLWVIYARVQVPTATAAEQLVMAVNGLSGAYPGTEVGEWSFGCSRGRQ